jgi:hypothetical protein
MSTTINNHISFILSGGENLIDYKVSNKSQKYFNSITRHSGVASLIMKNWLLSPNYRNYGLMIYTITNIYLDVR